MGRVEMSGNTVTCDNRGKGYYWIEAKKTSNPPAMLRAAPHNKGLSGMKCQIRWKNPGLGMPRHSWDSGHVLKSWLFFRSLTAMEIIANRKESCSQLLPMENWPPNCSGSARCSCKCGSEGPQDREHPGGRSGGPGTCRGVLIVQEAFKTKEEEAYTTKDWRDSD